MTFDQFWIEVIRAVAWPISFYLSVIAAASVMEDWLEGDK